MKFPYTNDSLTPGLRIPVLVTRTARFLSLISNQLTVRFAAKLFTTPFTFPTPKREQYMEQSAQHKKLFVDEIQQEVHVLSYGYSKKKVLLVHGWAGRSTQLFAFADLLLERGYMVISFDGPAHGKSTGKTTMMPEFLATLKALHSTYGPFNAAIGHSFGGMSLYNATARFLPLQALVVIGSGNTVREILANFIKNLTLKEKITSTLALYLEGKWKLNIDDYASERVAEKIDIPTLVIHDTLDGDVAVDCAYQTRKKLAKGNLLITHGLGHTKILRDPTIVKKTVNFIQHNT